MDKKEKEKQERQKNLNEFNSVTQKVKPENQNQEHNVRKEAFHPTAIAGGVFGTIIIVCFISHGMQYAYGEGGFYDL